MSKTPKISVQIEHADGETETVRMSMPLALAVLERILSPGWPHMTPIIDGKPIRRRNGSCCNAFITYEGERIVIP